MGAGPGRAPPTPSRRSPACWLPLLPLGPVSLLCLAVGCRAVRPPHADPRAPRERLRPQVRPRSPRWGRAIVTVHVGASGKCLWAGGRGDKRPSPVTERSPVGPAQCYRGRGDIRGMLARPRCPETRRPVSGGLAPVRSTSQPSPEPPPFRGPRAPAHGSPCWPG